MIQGALYLYGRSVALQTAREGVSQLRLAQTAAQCDAMTDAVAGSTTAYADSVGRGALTAASVTPTCSYPADGPSSVTVRVRGQAISLLGFTLHIDESATGAVEQFQSTG